MGAFLIMSNIRTMTETKKFEHVLVREPEYLSDAELMTSFGFIKIMSIIWVPIILMIILVIILKSKLIKR